MKIFVLALNNVFDTGCRPDWTVSTANELAELVGLRRRVFDVKIVSLRSKW